MIRKPPGAERASALRRSAEVALDSRDKAKAASRKVGNGCSMLGGIYMFVMFSFGALTTESWGAQLFGMAIVCGVAWLVIKARQRSGRKLSGQAPY